jgi:hypothetical protein
VNSFDFFNIETETFKANRRKKLEDLVGIVERLACQHADRIEVDAMSL